jgi:two-component system, OmpR family, sensor kinase
MVRTERLNGNRAEKSRKSGEIGAGHARAVGPFPHGSSGEQSWKHLFVMLEHEMRTPLAAALMQLSVAELAMRTGSPSLERAQGMLIGARRQIVGLLQILRRMMEVQTQGQIDLHRETLDMGRLATDLVDRSREANPGLWSRVQVVQEGTVVGLWDPSAVEQILQNLLSNALKFSKSTPVTLSIAPTRAGARIEVRDRGIGIAPEGRERIFDLFNRADSARGIAGQGIGLWVVQLLVRAHGGRIEVKSGEGEGTTFVVWLPGHFRPRQGLAPQGAPHRAA